MEELGVLLAGSPRTFFRIGIGLSRNSRAGMAVRAIASLAAGLGLFAGGQGRGVLLSSGAFKGDKNKLTYPHLAGAPTRIINMIQLGHALTALKPPVKALIVYNSNPLSVNPDGAMVRRGLLQRGSLYRRARTGYDANGEVCRSASAGHHLSGKSRYLYRLRAFLSRGGASGNRAGGGGVEQF